MSNAESKKKRTLRYTVPESFAEERLDRFLQMSDEQISRGLARKLIDLGGVHVNDRRVRKCGLKIKPADRVVVHIDGLSLTPYRLEAGDVVYRDRHLLVINKPSGVACQPTPARYKGTVYAALCDALADPVRKDLRPSIGMVQRLDRDTSGLMVFSIHPAAHKELSRMFSAREVVKTYRALVHGRLMERSGEFRSQLARRRKTNTVKSVARGGHEAITRYRLIDASRNVSHVEVDIPTGRMHQIRAHFAEAGHPLLGDLRYGGPDRLGELAVDRHMLHAARLAFVHPVKKEKLDFSLDLPYDMNTLIKTVFEESP